MFCHALIGALHDGQCERALAGDGGLAEELAGLLAPRPFQPRRQAQDHHVEEAADDRAQQRGDQWPPGRERAVRERRQHIHTHTPRTGARL
jgi:hypothetical protein